MNMRHLIAERLDGKKILLWNLLDGIYKGKSVSNIFALMNIFFKYTYLTNLISFVKM